MEKIINISGRDVPFKSTGAFLLRYKAQFGRDALGVLLKMEKTMKPLMEGNNEAIETLDLTSFLEIIWTLAKTADSTIPPPMEWLDTFDEFPLADIIPELQDLILVTIKSSVKSKNSMAGAALKK